MLINDLSRDAVLWCGQEGGEDSSSVGWQTRAAVTVVWSVLCTRTEELALLIQDRRRDPLLPYAFLSLVGIVRNKFVRMYIDDASSAGFGFPHHNHGLYFPLLV